MLTTDNVIQFKTGSIDGTSATVTFDNATSGDSSIIICTYMGSDTVVSGRSFNFPTGGSGNAFIQLGSDSSGSDWHGILKNFYKRDCPAGETTYTMTVSGTSGLGVWVAFEISNIGALPYGNLSGDQFGKTAVGAAAVSASTVSSDSSGFVPPTASSYIDAYNSLGVACFAATHLSSSAPTFSGYDITGTNGELQLHSTVSITSATYSITLDVCLIALAEAGRFQTSASVSPDSYVACDLATMYANDSKYTQKYDAIAGFEWGTANGLTTGSAVVTGTSPFDFSAGSPEVVTNIKRTGNYAGKLSSTAAAENFGWNVSGSLGVFHPVTGTHIPVEQFHFYFDGSLPSGDTEIAWIEAGSVSNGVRLFYRSSSQKLGLKIGTGGTEVLSDAVIEADKWIGVHLLYQAANTTTHLAKWYVDYDSLDNTAAVAQTDATATGMTAADITRVGYGWNDSTTATMYIDDIGYSKQWAAFPLEDIRIVGVKVDPAGTPTVSGTSANFGIFTNNSDIGAWDATGARNAVDEVPPAIGASADGVTQVSVAANDYVQFPMDTFVSTPNYILRGIRWYLAGWARSGNPGTLKVLSNDGVDDLFTVALGDHGFDDAATVWLCGMQRKKVAGVAAHYPLSQAKLDALTIRIGFSDDANPDVGIHNILAEVAYSEADVFGVVDGEDGKFTVYVKQDPVSGCIAGFLVTTPTGSRGATFNMTVNGTPTTDYVGPNTARDYSVGAASIEEVTSYGLAVDPT